MKREQPVSWLPIDSRLIFPLFTFKHVHGIARIFLIIEIGLAVSVVIGTFAVVMLRVIDPRL